MNYCKTLTKVERRNEAFRRPGRMNLTKESSENIYRKELATILSFSALIISSLDIDDVLDRAMKCAEEFIGAEASTVYELDEEKQELMIRVARGEKREPVKKITLKLGEGIAGYVVQTGKPMVVQNVSKEKKFSDKFDRMTGFKTHAMICVPLILRDRPLGALQVLNKKSADPFTRVELEVLVGMAQQIVVAMENAKLYRYMEEKVRTTTQELKIAQEKLIRSERLVAMGHLVQGVAHEIRNPVMTIGGFAQRIKRELKENHKLTNYINIVIEETSRLEHLVRQVREFADVQTANLTFEKVTYPLQEALKRFEPPARKLGVKIKTAIDRDLPPTKLDPGQMVIAFSHVLENALESMPNGGTLTIKAEQDENYIAIKVEDTGCGIAPEQLDAIYDPFVTSKTRGAGLGLTMVHQVVMNHHGEINMSSQLNKGTRVTIRLPITVA
jgi:signal transduction histidine kinase